MSKLDDILNSIDVYDDTSINEEEVKDAKRKIKALMLETYQAVRDKTRNEHELDELFTKAVNDL